MSRSNITYEAQDLAQQKCGVEIIDISKAFCDSNKCQFIHNQEPLFVDDDHMRWSNSTILTPYFKSIF